MGRKNSLPTCPGCGKAAIIDADGVVVFHTRADGSFYCVRQPKPDPAVRVPRPVPPPATVAVPPRRAARKSAPTPRADKVEFLVDRCTRCGSGVKSGRSHCRSCRRELRIAASTARPGQALSPRAASRSLSVVRARDAVLAGLGARRRTAGIRELRALVPDVVDSFVGTLTEHQLQQLRTDLAALGFRGRGAVLEFGQSVVTEIRRQREGVFRGVTPGGLPGSRR